MYINIFTSLTHKIKKFYKNKKICYNVDGDNMSEKEIEELFATSALFDKDSTEYKTTVMLNDIKAQTKTDSQDPLHLALSQATHLKDDVRNRYITLANMYTSDMQHNLFRNQFDLNNIYPEASIDEWNDFLSDRIVSVYIKKHKRTLLKNTAEDNLANPVAKNKRDNLQLIKNLEEQEANEANKNVCIIRIPDIYDE